MASVNNVRGLSVQWALNETSDAVIGVAKGLLKAATSDNIQVTVLLVAESFGSTLAICQETQTIVEFESKKQHISYVLEFLKSQIGYSKNDAAYALAQTTAGLRFLSLAAALTTLGSYQAALCLQSMMKNSASENQLLPGIIHLRDLMAALEYKTVNVGFANQIIGWQLLLFERIETLMKQPGHQFGSSADGIAGNDSRRPSNELIEAMVKAFRELERVGDAVMVHISADTSIPWIIAFIKWCLGKPPSLVLEDGNVVLEQPASKVVVQVNSVGGLWQVEVSRELTSLKQIFRGGARQDLDLEWSGMIPIQLYGRRQFYDQAWFPEQSYRNLVTRGICQALVYGLKKALTELIPRTHPSMSILNRPSGTQPSEPSDPASVTRSQILETAHIEMPPHLRRRLGTIFISQRRIEQALADFIDQDRAACELKDLSENQKITDLGNVSATLKKIEQECDCRYCGDDPSSEDICTKIEYEEQISWITAIILAISLFDCTEPIKLFYENDRTNAPPELRGRHKFFDVVHNLLFSRNQSYQETWAFTDILDFALWLIGHDASQDLEDGTWISSASKGQLIYLHSLEAGLLNGSGLLRLGGGPGKLFYEGVSYNKVLSHQTGSSSKWMPHSDEYHHVHTFSDLPVQEPRNLFLRKGNQIVWQLAAAEDHLRITYGLKGGSPVFNPLHAIGTALRCLFIPPCAHPSTSQIIPSVMNAVYVAPYWEGCARLKQIGPPTSKDSRLEFEAPDPDKIAVVAVSGDEALRFYALSSNAPGVIMMGSCLQCAVDKCHEAGYPYIVC